MLFGKLQSQTRDVSHSIYPAFRNFIEPLQNHTPVIYHIVLNI